MVVHRPVVTMDLLVASVWNGIVPATRVFRDRIWRDPDSRCCSGLALAGKLAPAACRRSRDRHVPVVRLPVMSEGDANGGDS